MKSIQENQKKAIEDRVGAYVKAYLNADAKGLQESFFKEAVLYSAEKDRLDSLPLGDWLPSIESRKKNGDLRSGSSEIMSLDITEHAATVKLRLRLAAMEFTDYLTLIELQGNWRIIAKTYAVHILDKKNEASLVPQHEVS